MNGEFTLCGDAFDAFESGDADEPVHFAAPGQLISCPKCREVINHCKAVKHWKEPTNG